nr:MAG TPA: hypothetical protein [Caudoviricetes sp.]
MSNNLFVNCFLSFASGKRVYVKSVTGVRIPLFPHN